jgi:Lrp/AsnC family transcriptional regulator, leucine-responsive regulatory protein
LDNPRFRINDAFRRAPNLDKIDLAILEWVEDDFDVSLETLAEELDLSKSATHCRLNKRMDSDVIRASPLTSIRSRWD